MIVSMPLLNTVLMCFRRAIIAIELTALTTTVGSRGSLVTFISAGQMSTSVVIRLRIVYKLLYC